MSKPLPSSIGTEKALLSCCLQDRSVLGRALFEVGEDLFFNPQLKRIWQIMHDLGDNAQCVTIQDRISSQHEFDFMSGILITDLLLESPSPIFYEHYLKELEEYAARRAAIGGAARVMDAATHGDDFREIAAATLSALADRREARVPDDIRSMLLEYLDDLEARMEGKVDPGIQTRWEQLNDLTGGLPNGNLIMVGGERGGGKSILAQNLAEDCMASGKRVVWFSYEMPRREILSRLIASSGTVPASVLFRPAVHRPTLQHTEAISGVIKSLTDANLLRLRNSPLGVADIRLDCLRETRDGQVGLIIVDYLQLVPPDKAIANREQQVATISRSLRALALELDVPVVALSQLNREGDSRESMAIEQDASIVLKLQYRDDVERQDGNALLRVDKNRNGAAHVVIPLKHRRGFFNFVEA